MYNEYHDYSKNNKIYKSEEYWDNSEEYNKTKSRVIPEFIHWTEFDELQRHNDVMLWVITALMCLLWSVNVLSDLMLVDWVASLVAMVYGVYELFLLRKSHERVTLSDVSTGQIWKSDDCPEIARYVRRVEDSGRMTLTVYEVKLLDRYQSYS